MIFNAIRIFGILSTMAGIVCALCALNLGLPQPGLTLAGLIGVVVGAMCLCVCCIIIKETHK